MILTNQTFFAKTEAQLLYIIKDATEAEVMFRNHDAIAAAKYSEQIHDALTVLGAREREAA